MLRTIRRSLSAILVIVSIFLLVWAAIPNGHQNHIQDITLSEMKPQNGDGRVSIFNMDTRRVTLEWPKSMRIGETEVITLRFEPEGGTAPASAAQMGGNDIYERYNLMAEARFEVAGVRVEPANPIRESMPRGQVVKFRWQISSSQSGTYDGTVWLSLRLLPLDGSPTSQNPVFIKEITFQAKSLFGMSEAMATILGGVGVVVAGGLVFDDMIRGIWRRIKKKTTKYSKETKV